MVILKLPETNKKTVRILPLLTEISINIFFLDWLVEERVRGFRQGRFWDNQPNHNAGIHRFTHWGILSSLTIPMLQMILKSMSVECNKTDMDNYAAEVDEEDSGKFTFLQFCSVRKNTLYLILVQFPSRYIQGQLNVPGKGIKLSKFVSSPLIDWELFISCGNDWSKTSPTCAHLP